MIPKSYNPNSGYQKKKKIEKAAWKQKTIKTKKNTYPLRWKKKVLFVWLQSVKEIKKKLFWHSPCAD